MQKRKYSLYVTLSLIIVTTVTIIMFINSTYSYIKTKNKTKAKKGIKIKTRIDVLLVKFSIFYYNLINDLHFYKHYSTKVKKFK